MAVLNSKTIKNKIKSVRNTKKITKTMEMIAATKMRKSVGAVINTKLYSKIALNLLSRLSKIDPNVNPFLLNRETKRVLIILMTSNRGLCGSFNTNILKVAENKFNTMYKGKDIDVSVIGIGKRSAKFAKRNGLDLVAIFDDINDTPRFDNARIVSKMIIDGYIEGKYDQVDLIYTEFISSLTQICREIKLLPLTADMVEPIDSEDDEFSQDYIDQELDINNYIFEPDVTMVIDYVIPKLIEIQIYQALLESSASEHSARMIAMKNANESAGEMIRALTLEFNKARQAAITKEISEITNGAEALNE
ncbi:ATP synthase F1 subunit gamma [Candidatus Dojkabacteria bacterium]|nr:ATP synthase F1 subunit gamma [Candidatus Dojkabacteria bacterium]